MTPPEELLATAEVVHLQPDDRIVLRLDQPVHGIGPELAKAAPAMLAAIRAAYALAKEMAKAGEQPDTHGEFDRGVAAHQRDAAARLRIALDEALGVAK